MNPTLRLVSVVGRRWPLKRGCGGLSRTSPAKRLAGRHRAVRVRLATGAWAYVDTDDMIGRAMAIFGEWDPKISWVLSRVLRPGDRMIDGGAHFGLTTLHAARLVGPSGHVVAYEPQPGVAANLRRSIAENGLANVTLHEVALSDHDGEAALYVPVGHYGGASFDRTYGERIEVPVRTVHAGRQFAADEVAGARLLKLDIEGHEPVVVGAAADVLREGPDVILFEQNAGDGSDAPDTAAAVAELGYELYELPAATFRVRAVPFHGGDCNDLIGVRPDRRHTLSRLEL